VTVLGELARSVSGLHPGRRIRVAVDGVDASGKTTFADALADAVRPSRPVVRATVDRFHRPRSERLRRGALSPEGCYRDSFDHDALWRELLSPFGPEGSGQHRTGVHDHESDIPSFAPVEPSAVDAALLVDGVFLQRPELRAAWDVVVLLTVTDEEVLRRAVARDARTLGSAQAVLERYRRRYLPAQALYEAEAEPHRRADWVVDNEDPSSPVLVARAGVRG
jgi:uridine kinase